MRRYFGPVFLLGIACASPPAHATIEKIESCGTQWGGNVVSLTRGQVNDLTVSGFGVDLATSVDTTLKSTPLTVVSRKNGFGSNIVLRLEPPAAGNPANGVVTLHYFGGGTDSFNVSVPAGPTVTSVAFVSDPGITTSGGTTRVTSLDPHIVVLKGTNLDAIDLSPGAGTGSFTDLRIVLQVAGEVRVSFHSASGDRSIDASLFRVAASFCSAGMPRFSLGFTVFDPPRTPTPTPTATPTRTPTPPKFAPIHVTPGLRPPFGPTPTPTLVPFKPKGAS